MATLLNTQSKQEIILRSQHIFGRHSGACNTVLDNPEASRLHASILWNGTFWQLQDSSSNGTYINNKPIVTGIKTRLMINDEIQFGAQNSCSWKFIEDHAPNSMLVPIKSASKAIELDGIVVLPDDSNPEITLYQQSNGQWICENQSGSETIESGAKISTKTNSWYFIDANVFDETKQVNHNNNLKPAPINVNFSVSQDEEHVSLSIQLENKVIDLGERTHHYLLLILARKRMADKLKNLDDKEQGWIDKSLLCQQIGLDENHINILIYRFRKQLIQARPEATQLLQIVERRRGELRFSEKEINIIGGNEMAPENYSCIK